MVKTKTESKINLITSWAWAWPNRIRGVDCAGHNLLAVGMADLYCRPEAAMHEQTFVTDTETVGVDITCNISQ